MAVGINSPETISFFINRGNQNEQVLDLIIADILESRQ